MIGVCRHGSGEYDSCEICQRLMKMGSYPLAWYENHYQPSLFSLEPEA